MFPRTLTLPPGLFPPVRAVARLGSERVAHSFSEQDVSVMKLIVPSSTPLSELDLSLIRTEPHLVVGHESFTLISGSSVRVVDRLVLYESSASPDTLRELLTGCFGEVNCFRLDQHSYGEEYFPRHISNELVRRRKN